MCMCGVGFFKQCIVAQPQTLAAVGSGYVDGHMHGLRLRSAPHRSLYSEIFIQKRGKRTSRYIFSSHLRADLIRQGTFLGKRS